MFFDQKDLKSKFLQKKHKQKKKIQQTQQQNYHVLLIQKNIRAFLHRKVLKQILKSKNNINYFLLFDLDISNINQEQLKCYTEELISNIKNESFVNNNSLIIEQKQQSNISPYIFYLSKLFFALIKNPNQQFQKLSFRILEWLSSNNQLIFKYLIKNKQFIKVLNLKFNKQSINKLLNLSIQYLSQQKLLGMIKQSKLYETLIDQFKKQKMQVQNVLYERLKPDTFVMIVLSLNESKYQVQNQFKKFQYLSKLTLFLINFSYKIYGIQTCLSFLIENLLKIADYQRKILVEQISKKQHNFLVLMQDQQDLAYFQNKIMNDQKMQNYSNILLKTMQQIFQRQEIIKMFHDKQKIQTKIIKQTMINSIKLLSKNFQDRKIIFLRSLLSSNQLLEELYTQKSQQFYQGLKMKLMAMDDQDFKQFNLFNQNQWNDIIHTAIYKSFKIIKSQLTNPNYMKKKLIPFQSKDQQNLTLIGLSQTLENLYKKSIRTKKLREQIFISKQFTQAFYTFNFGSGALAMQKLLKLYPFCFTFQSRLQKFKKIIKQDKLNHDRTLFLQQQVNTDLIITVRRGYQFLDAYQQCFGKDLRKKYKLVFFNQQGLEEEGIDGGGLIKQFINRVLKSSFSDVYGLFQENSKHQIIPNPYSPSTQEYQFIGKIIGKAVYQGISIQQKFVQPFLNLLIGRKNTFQDIQYIDPLIYKSLVDIKHMGNQIQDLQQTFVILDQQPNGIKKYIDLLCPSKQPKGNNQVFVTKQNKLQFVMAYSDFKCNKQLEQKTRFFRKGFLKVLKAQWLTLFNNQQLNKIISGGQVDFDISQLKNNCVYTDYHQKSLTIVYFWQILKQLTPQQKSLFLLYVTSCSRPPTLGFGSLKPTLCISRDQNVSHLPTANTCMNILRLPDYQNKQIIKNKLLYAINSKAGFQFA